ncbi:tyrosine-protein phosphatase [Actinomadura scrupuli]|uniref:tyrosine-protein phosphatase n=1 Tax=Actinomadura scrupuli TaxID=559629 RepID=UPI003D9864A0
MEREIALEGCANFRDVGGYPADGGHIAWRRLFRSDALHELTPADVARLTDLGLTTVIDLRSDFERGHDGAVSHPLAAADPESVAVAERRQVTFVHAPIINEANGAFMVDGGLSLAQRYAKIIEATGTALADTVTAIADAPGAAVFHCAAGKDRTGMVSAVVLGALGVSDEDIIADYAMTGRNLSAIDARLRRHAAYENAYQYVPRDAMTADDETMRDLIAHLRARHGSMTAVLRDAGVGEDVLDRLRAALVRPGP